MKFTKKFISVLLAFVLVLGTLSVSSFAWTGDGTQQAKISLVPDKEFVSAGDTVNVDVVLNLAEGGSWSTFGNFLFSFMYDKDVVTPVSSTWGPTVADFAGVRGPAVVTAAAQLNNVKNSCTADEKAAWDANGYDAMCRIQAMKEATTLYGGQGYWEAADGEVLVTITLEVADNVADGTPVRFDVVSGLFSRSFFYLATATTAGQQTIQRTANLYDVTAAVAPVTVGSAAPDFDETTPSIIDSFKYQMRNNTDGTLAVRNLATIDGAALDKYLKDEALLALYADKATSTQTAEELLAKDLILDMGFVMTRSESGKTFDKAAAAAWHQGKADGDYTDVNVSYLSTGMSEGNYTISCIIKSMPVAEIGWTLSTLGYIVLDTNFDGEADEYHYYDAVQSTTFTALYNNKGA